MLDNGAATGRVLTMREALLVAIRRAGQALRKADIAVVAAHYYPEWFAMREYLGRDGAPIPDTNRSYPKLDGAKGLVRRGWVLRERGWYSITLAGIRLADVLHPPEDDEPNTAPTAGTNGKHAAATMPAPRAPRRRAEHPLPRVAALMRRDGRATLYGRCAGAP